MFSVNPTPILNPEIGATPETGISAHTSEFLVHPAILPTSASTSASASASVSISESASLSASVTISATASTSASAPVPILAPAPRPTGFVSTFHIQDPAGPLPPSPPPSPPPDPNPQPYPEDPLPVSS